jgi:hypothetical protein
MCSCCGSQCFVEHRRLMCVEVIDAMSLRFSEAFSTWWL